MNRLGLLAITTGITLMGWGLWALVDAWGTR